MKLSKTWIALGIAAFAGYFAWLVLVNNRYQTLCQVHYLEATPAQIESCNEIKRELDGK